MKASTVTNPDMFRSVIQMCRMEIANSLLRLRVPSGLYKILGSYFKNRVLIYEADKDLVSAPIAAGVPQESILCPLLWNVI